MNEPKVSIISPVYKAELYIHKCIDSIIVQTLSDWELILVDDGSPDNSGKICDEYVSRDKRIKVIHKQNGGVSAARQTGLDAATGEYIIHADPDDWVEPTMLEDLYRKAKEDDADMVICDFYRDDETGSSYIKQEPPSLHHQVVLKEMFQHLHGSCWNKLVKRACINKYDVRFPDGVNYSEDVCVNVQILVHDIKIGYLAQAYYHYVQLSSSITNNFTKRTLETCVKFVDFLGKYLEKDSTEIMSAKEMIKRNVVNSAIFTNKEILHLYPEIKSSASKKIYNKVGYCLAFHGFQNCGRLVLKNVRLLVQLRNCIKK